MILDDFGENGNSTSVLHMERSFWKAPIVYCKSYYYYCSHLVLMKSHLKQSYALLMPMACIYLFGIWYYCKPWNGEKPGHSNLQIGSSLGPHTAAVYARIYWLL